MQKRAKKSDTSGHSLGLIEGQRGGWVRFEVRACRGGGGGSKEWPHERSGGNGMKGELDGAHGGERASERVSKCVERSSEKERGTD